MKKDGLGRTGDAMRNGEICREGMAPDRVPESAFPYLTRSELERAMEEGWIKAEDLSMRMLRQAQRSQ